MESIMNFEKKFEFRDEDDSLLITIPEKLEAAYGTYVWPCSVVLAQYIWYNRKHLLVKKNVLELGAGTALPSVVAAKCGNAASVTLTDDPHQPKSLENCMLSCGANSIDAGKLTTDCLNPESSVKVTALRWGEVSSPIFIGLSEGTLPYPDIILGSDCFFEESVFEKILFTVRHLFEGMMAKNNACTEKPLFLCTYQIRNRTSTIEDLLILWGMKCKSIPLSSFRGDGYNIANSGMPGNHEIQLLEITMND